MANLADFRGAGEPDSGTAFEIGFATALGKPVFAYTSDVAPLIERVPQQPNARGRAEWGNEQGKRLCSAAHKRLPCSSPL
jgi:nucleoside deoxyribosyltransferase